MVKHNSIAFAAGSSDNTIKIFQSEPVTAQPGKRESLLPLFKGFNQPFAPFINILVCNSREYGANLCIFLQSRIALIKGAELDNILPCRFRVCRAVCRSNHPLMKQSRAQSRDRHWQEQYPTSVRHRQRHPAQRCHQNSRCRLKERSD